MSSPENSGVMMATIAAYPVPGGIPIGSAVMATAAPMSTFDQPDNTTVAIQMNQQAIPAVPLATSSDSSMLALPPEDGTVSFGQQQEVPPEDQPVIGQCDRCKNDARDFCHNVICQKNICVNHISIYEDYTYCKGHEPDNPCWCCYS